MKNHRCLFNIVITGILSVLVATSLAVAQQQDLVVQYGPEWEAIKQSYEQLTDNFQQQRNRILNDTTLSDADKVTRIQQEYDGFMTESRKLAARRGEIIKIAAEKHGLKVSLGSDPTKGRGMAGDIDLAGTPAQTKKFMAELKKIGIADAFDDIHCIERTPGYLSIKGPMDTTVNYNGRLGAVGTSAYDTQIRFDARSAETYLSFDMAPDQPGRTAVETLDHLRKAKKGLKTSPGQFLNQPEALQVSCKGTLKAMETMKITDGELKVILKQSGLDMTPNQFMKTLDGVRKGNNIAPELSKLGDKNIKAFHSALDETVRVCRNKAVQSFENDMNRARGLEKTLRSSNDPVVRKQITEVRAGLIDSNTRMRENLNSLIEMDDGNLSLRQQQAQVELDNARRSGDPVRLVEAETNLQNVSEHIKVSKTVNENMKLRMKGLENGTGFKPAGATVLGNTNQYRLPGADMLDDVIQRGISGYQNFRNNETIAKTAGYGMQAFGAGMVGLSWYSSSIAQGDSTELAAAKGIGAGLFSVTKFGSAVMGVQDMYYNWTEKAEQYRKDQGMYYALSGMNPETDEAKERLNTLIDRKVWARRGVYTIVKGTSFSSIFFSNPALMVTGAALEAGLAVYEAKEQADLWKMYADELEKVNDQVDQGFSDRGAWIAQQVSGQLKARAEQLTKTAELYTDLMKERDSVAQLRQSFMPANEQYQEYLQGLTRQAQQIQNTGKQDAADINRTLTVLKQVVSQAKQAASHARDTANGLQQNPERLAAAQGVLATLTSEYQALAGQINNERGNATQAAMKMQLLTEGESPVAVLENYRQQLVSLAAYLKPRYDSVGNLMNISNQLGQSMNSVLENRDIYIQRIGRYENFLRTRRPDAKEQLATVRQALSTLKSISLPAWKNNYQDDLKNYYMNIKVLYEAVQDTQELINEIYPEPVKSLYKQIDPQTVGVCREIPAQWSQVGQAMTEFYSELSRLHSAVGSAKPIPEEKKVAEDETANDEGDSEEYTDLGDMSDSELRAELNRLEALKAELSRRCQARIDDLNKVYFQDRDSLWKAYEAAFKNPRMMFCDNCKTETLHSMDYSDNPPSVWCNSCGAIYSFSKWAGAGKSFGQIREVGLGKKAEIQSQLETNLRAVDAAIQQVRAAIH